MLYLFQERFGFSNKPFVPFSIPVTYTTSLEKNFELEKIYPVKMVDTSQLLVFDLGEEDWVIFNIQGQGKIQQPIFKFDKTGAKV